MAGLTPNPFASTTLEKMDLGDRPNPYAPYSPTSGMGIDNLRGSSADMVALGESLTSGSQFTMPKMVKPPSVAFSKSRNQMYVQGITFDADDDQQALDAESLLNQPGVGLPTGGDWEPLDANAYGQYTAAIRNPSMGRLASKNFGRGVDVTQMLAGRGLQFLGAEETGAGVVAAQEEDLRKTSPYERAFTDIGEPNRGVLDWFVGNLAQQGPNLLLSALSGGAGAAAGGALARSAAFRTLSNRMTTPATQQSIMSAAKKYAAGEKLNPAEIKILHEASGVTAAAQIQNTLALGTQNIGAAQTALQASLGAARTRGAGVGLAAQGYATGVADIYGETIEGGDPDRATAAVLGIPYAALENLFEFGVASQVIKAASGRGLPLRAAGAGPLTRRVVAGIAIGGVTEGATEAGQEGILLGVNQQVDWDSPEGINRLVNSFAAGFGVGGPLGGLGGLASRGRDPANLLNPAQTTEPTPMTPGMFDLPPSAPPRVPSGAAPGTQGDLFGGPPPFVGPPAPIQVGPPTPTSPSPLGPRPQQGDFFTGEFVGPAIPSGPPMLPPPGGVMAIRNRPGFVVDSAGNTRPATTDDVVVDVMEDIPPTYPGQQGVLNIFGGQPVTTGEIGQRMQPPAAPVAPAPAPQVVPEGQGELPFGLRPLPQVQGELPLIRPLPLTSSSSIRPPQTAAAPVTPQTPISQSDFFAGPQQAEMFGPPPPYVGPLRRGAAPLPETMEEQVAERVALVDERAGLIRAIDQAKGRRRMSKNVRDARVRLREIDARLKQLPPESPPDVGQTGFFTSAGNATMAALRGAGTRQPVGAPVEDLTVRQAPSVSADKMRQNIAKLQRKAQADAKAAEEARAQAEADAKAAEEARKTAERAAKAAEKLRKGEARAVQKRSAEKVPARKPARASEEVGTEVPAQPATARKGEALRKGQEQAPKPTVQKQAPVSVNELVRRGQLKQAGNQWSTYANTGEQGKWGDLTDTQQEAWRVAVFSERGPSVADTLEIAPAKRGAPPAPKGEAAVAAEEVWADNAEATDPQYADLSQDLKDRWEQSDKSIKAFDRIVALARAKSKEQLAAEAEKAKEDLTQESDETKWNNIAADDDVRYASLPASAKAAWAESNKTAPELDNIIDAVNDGALEMDNVEMLEFAVAGAEAKRTSGTLDAFSDYAEMLVNLAYLTDESKGNKPLVLEARRYVEDTAFTEQQREVIDQRLIEEVNALGRLEVYSNKRPQAWFTYLEARGQLPNIRSVLIGLPAESAVQYVKAGMLSVSNLAPTLQKQLRDELQAAGVTVAAPARTEIIEARASEAERLVNQIRVINGNTGESSTNQIQQVIVKLRDLYAKVPKNQRDYAVNKKTELSDFFNDKGEPKIQVIDKILRVSTETSTDTEDRARRAKTQENIAEANLIRDKQRKPGPGDPPRLRSTLEGWNTFGKNFLDDGRPLTGPMAVGKIRIAVANFLRKLVNKPTVHLYANVADLKAKNPRLYEQAVAARPQGDFDTVSAVGYSFGDGQVIIFTDRVATERQLKFVLAHETLGHFGFRGIMSERELANVMNMVYNSSAKVRAGVDMTMAVRKSLGESISRTVATEEYLADLAGTLDNNLLARLWSRIKDALNKIGVRFDDDMARYVVAQARRYVKNGGTSGSFFDPAKMAMEMSDYEGMQDPMGSGRYAINSESFGQFNGSVADAVLNAPRRDLNYSEFTRKAKAAGIDFKELYNTVVENLQTINFASRENRGFRRLYEIVRDTNHRAAKLRAEYNAMMETVLTPATEMLGRTFGGGATEEQTATTSRMLRTTTRAKHGALTDDQLREIGNLIRIVDGRAILSPEVFARLKAMGRFTIEDFRRGIKYTVREPATMTAQERTRLEGERDTELAAMDAEIFQAENAVLGTTGDEKTRAERYLAKVKDKKKAKAKGYKARIEAPTYLAEKTYSEQTMPGLTENSKEWQMYNEVRDTMDRSAIDMLLANYAAARAERDNILQIAARFLGRPLTNENRTFLERIEDRYLTIRDENPIVREDGTTIQSSESLIEANKFMAQFNQAVLGLDTDLNDPFAKAFFEADDQKSVVDGIEALKAGSRIRRDEGEKFSMQQAIQNLALFELSRRNAELYAANSIAGGYVPLGRDGKWQVRIVATDPNTGDIRELSQQYRNQMIFIQTELRSEAEAYAGEIETLFGDTTFDAEVLGDDRKFGVMKVKFKVVAETARQTDDNAGPINLNDVVRVLNKFSIALHPSERERLVVGLTQQDASARKRLQRSGNPGEDPNTIKYVSGHLESVASVVARKENQHFIDRLYDKSEESNELWSGSQAEYDRLKAARDAAIKNPMLNDPQRSAARKEFEAYHFTFVVNESAKKANLYKDRGQRMIEFLNAQRSVEFTDFGSGELGSKLRLFTTYAFMGLSPATAILNYFSLPLNVLPALAGYNPKNGFGGGFGLGRTAREMTRALRQTSGINQSDLAYWDKLLGTEENKRSPEAIAQNLAALGLTRAEADFLRKEVSEGTMQAALTNSMLGSARGRMTSGYAQTGARAIMGMFNYTEQAARRATGLAAFRMAYDRAKGANKSDEQAFIEADKFAVDMIENTLGEYAMFNRPALFRGGVAQFAFMYKMFVVNTVQLLKALPRDQKLLALGLLVLFAGLKNLPFAEDIFDLIDTIAQRLGLGPSALWRGSMEKTIAETVDALVPGLSPILLRGALNYLTPGNVADRVGLGNIVPGSGIGLVGNTSGFRELMEVTGPVGSFIQQSLATGFDVARYGLETVGVVEDKTSLTSILRTSPVTMLRAGADIATYYDTGTIVNQKGYVVSKNLHAGTYLARALGFYPEAASSANAGIAVLTRVSNYRKDIAAEFYGKYVAASLAQDSEKVQEVRELVEQWNEDTEGTGLEISNFTKNAQRALREARRPAGDRFLRTLPISARAEAQRTLDILAPDGMEGE